MAIVKTIGGNRLGSGNKMKAAMHNYERSTHNMGNGWASSMAPGVLVPFYKKLALNGDTWSINLETLIKTMPAIGPCFGSYKVQFDFFEIPIRLYNGVLHNNMVKIGMDMSKVKLPSTYFFHNWINPQSQTVSNEKTCQVHPSSLMHYLGLKGLMDVENSTNDTENVMREVPNIVPMLAYYDIFKNYYANKQEENAYVIDNNVTGEANTTLNSVKVFGLRKWTGYFEELYQHYIGRSVKSDTQTYENYDIASPGAASHGNRNNASAMQYFTIKFNGDVLLGTTAPILEWEDTNGMRFETRLTDTAIYNKEWDEENNQYKVQIYNTGILAAATNAGITNPIMQELWLEGIAFQAVTNYTSETYLRKFKLENIDTMRMALLQNTQLGTSVNMINSTLTRTLYPYAANWNNTHADGNSGLAHPMTGLVVKTYQSDYFNAWMSHDWIDGVNGISEITAVDTSAGNFKIDALNIKNKVYNMLNRIAVSGGTYEDWQEAVYGEDALRRAESPIYCGGMSGTICFEEVVSTSDTETSAAGDQPLGSLAGKGTLVNVTGGHIEIHIKEPSYIMGIVSITPHLYYSHGNDFDLTEIESMNDVHKPALDQIGFQDLMLETAAWWTTYLDASDQTIHKQAGGKTPAWLLYMTSWNEVHGDFAEKEKLGWMILNRDYDKGWAYDNNSELDPNAIPRSIKIKDWTTYINPSKYNYMFAETKLNSQNFWVQIAIHAELRRKISAKLIPNL